MLTGGCLCGQIRFQAEGEPRMRGLCLCRTCQKVSGGAGNMFIGLMAADFRYTAGEPARFALSETGPVRDFCPTCGVHLAARSPRAPDGVILKVGALDHPAAYEGPALVVWTSEAEPFHHIPEGVPAFATVPGR